MVELLVNFMESIYTFFLYIGVFPCQHKSVKQLFGIIVMSVGITYLNYLHMDIRIQLLMVWFLYTLYARVCFVGSKVEKIFWSSVRILITVFSDRLSIRVMMICGINNIFTLLGSGKERYTAMIIYLFCTGLLILILRKIKKLDIKLPLYYQAILMGFVLFIVIEMSLLSDGMMVAYQSGEKTIIYILDAVFVFMILIIICVFLCICELSNIYEKNNILRIKQQKEEMLWREYKTLKENQERMRGWKHDLNNHLYMLRQLSKKEKYQEVTEYLDQLSDEINKIETIIDTGNLVVDIIITNKIKEARKNKINVICGIMDAEGFPITESQITILLGNILDNAIEANLEVIDEKKRFIRIQIKPYKSSMIIAIENRFNGILIRGKNGYYKTKKTNKGHGIGMQQIGYIVELAGGIYHVENSETVFKTMIVLPII